jgi:DNA-binding IclR family transcriptional regulator
MLNEGVERGTATAGRVADVLLAVADSPGPAGVSQIARRLGLSKAVVYRILRSLVDRGLISDSGGSGVYQLGPAALRLGARALESFDLRRLALPVLRELQALSGETATVSALSGLSRVYLDQVVSLNEIRMTVDLGTPLPLHAGGTGKVILAFAVEEVREAVLNTTLQRLTDWTITDADVLRESLAKIRSEGYGTSRGERESGAASVAAPLFGPDGFAIGALSVCGPRDRVGPERLLELAPAVCRAADTVTLGVSGVSPSTARERQLAQAELNATLRAR